MQILVCEAIYWMNSKLFGTFAVRDDIDDLVMYGEEVGTPPLALFAPGAVVCFGLYIFGGVLYQIFSKWRAVKMKHTRHAVGMELSEQEASWKEAWLLDLQSKAAAHDKLKMRRSEAMQHLEDAAEGSHYAKRLDSGEIAVRGESLDIVEFCAPAKEDLKCQETTENKTMESEMVPPVIEEEKEAPPPLEERGQRPKEEPVLTDEFIAAANFCEPAQAEAVTDFTVCDDGLDVVYALRDDKNESATTDSCWTTFCKGGASSAK